MNRIGANAVAASIRSHGNETVFALGGHAHFRVLDELDQMGVRIIGGRHESAVIAAADGYARITGRSGVAIIIAEQGAANAYAGLLTAKYACVPIVVLIVRFSTAYDDPRSEEEVSQFAGLRDCVKWARTVPHPERLGEYVDAAFRIAEGGEPGPVLVALQGAFLDSRVTEKEPESRERFPHPLGCPGEVAQEVAEVIQGSQRPVILAGGGSRFGNASGALTRIGEATGIPVVGRGLGRGVVDETSAAGWSWPVAQHALHMADLVLAIGARLDQKMSYGLPPRFSPTARLIQVDVAPENLGAPRNIYKTVVADAGEFSSVLEQHLVGAKESTLGGWWIRDAVASVQGVYREVGKGISGKPHPAETARLVSAHMSPNDIMVTDGAKIRGWMLGIHEVRRCPGWIDHAPLGSMGICTGLAIGAACGTEDEARSANGTAGRVVLFTGDGAIGYFASEFSTMARHNLRIVTVIGNDGAWGTERDWQLRSFGRTVNTELGDWDYAQVASGFGCRARRIETQVDLGTAIKWAFDSVGPVVLDVTIDPEAGSGMRDGPPSGGQSSEDLVRPEAGVYPEGLRDDLLRL